MQNGKTEWSLRFSGTARIASERVEFHSEEPDDVLQMIENDAGRRNVKIFRNGTPVCTIIARGL